MPGAKPKSQPVELTYPLRAAARLTGLSPALLRAWEKRYGAVEPRRTEGGTRRYTGEDLERLRLLKAAVDAGHRIGEVAKLGAAELERRAAAREQAPRGEAPIATLMASLERLDGAEVQRLLALQLSALGPVAFASDVAAPLAREIGERWGAGRLSIGAEHLATAALRSLLGSALHPSMVSRSGPKVVFATAAGERHELGLLMAALAAAGAGANPIYLGSEVPVDDLLSAVERAEASALALSLVNRSDQASRTLSALRSGLPPEVAVWVGGAAASETDLPEGVECIDSLDHLERRVALLVLQPQDAG